MGEDAAHDAGAWDNEVPRRRVYLDGYWIGRYPVTLAQYAAFLRATEQPANKAGGYAARTRLHPDSADFTALSIPSDTSGANPMNTAAVERTST